MQKNLNALTKNITRRLGSYLPAMAAIIVIVAAWILTEQQNQQLYLQAQRAKVQTDLALLRSNLEGELNANIQLIRGLVATISTEPEMDQTRFSELSSRILDQDQQIRNIAAAPNLVISLVYPVAENISTIGLDYNTNEAQREAALKVHDSGKMVLAGPVELVQGGRGLILRFPVFIFDSETPTFWGIISAVIDIERLYRQSGVLSPDLSIDFALIGKDSKGPDGDQFFGAPEIRNDKPVTAEIRFPTGTWQLAARPKGGWGTTPTNLTYLRLGLLLASALIFLPTLLAGRSAEARKAIIKKLRSRESELTTVSRRLSIAIESSKIGIWDFDAATDRVMWNDRMNAIYEYPSDIKHHSFKTWSRRIHPEDRPRAIEDFQVSLETGVPYESEFRLLLDGGLQKNIRSVGAVYCDADGQKSMVGVNLDISKDANLRDELQRTNEELTNRNSDLQDGKAALEAANEKLKRQQQESHRLSMIAKHANDSILMTDSQANILWVNDAFTKMTGYRFEEAVGASPGDLLNGPETDPAVISRIADHVKLGRPLHTEILNYTRSGAKIWVDSNIVPIKGVDGTDDLIIGIERDITASKKHAEELSTALTAAEMADRAKSEFLANMSHEIRTPMNGIVGMADLLHESSLENEQRLFVETIRDSADKLLAIINDILDLSRLEEDGLSINPVDFDIYACLQSVINLLHGQATTKGLTLELDVIATLPERVHGDAGRIQQILVNLIGNALKFTEKGGVQVRVSVSSKGPVHDFVIEVHDTGLGISPVHLKHVFNRFAQADAATTRKFGGTGLGLTISCLLTRLMGGTITVESELGKGSCFRLQLPIEAGTKEPIANTPKQPLDLQALEGAVILVAEDNRTNRLLIEKYLAGLPVKLIFAENGEIAVQLARSHAPDLVIMDMSMPVKNGIEATKEIRSDDMAQPIIIGLTANAFATDREACLSSGMDHFLSKPVRKTVLLETLANSRRAVYPG